MDTEFLIWAANQASETTIHLLPDQILLQIFLYLKLRELIMVSSVCQRWHRLCYDSRLWINLDLSQDMQIRKVNNKSVKYILRRTTSIREINLSGRKCKRVGNHSLTYISRHCPQLKSLNVASRIKILDKGMKKIVQACPNLENINMEGCLRISNGSLIYIGKNCPSLRSINLGRCKLVQDFGLEALVKNCKNITTISLENCRQVTDEGLRIIADNCLLLKSINLKRMRRITNSGIREFLEKVPILELSIGLMRMGGITDAAFYVISRQCPQLEMFEFEHFARYEVDGCVLRLAEGCRRLTRLYLYRCYPLSDMTLMRITQICPRLTDIHLFPESFYPG